MARIFNRIRKDLLSVRKLKEYLLYAVGEIILVVAGILIALQINTWNEERKKEAEFLETLLSVRQDLVQDTAEISSTIEEYTRRRSIYQRVLGDSATAEDYQKPDYTTLIMQYTPVAINERGYDLLKEYKTLNRSVYDSLTLRLNVFYSYYIDRIGEDRKKVTDDHLKNIDYWKQHQAILAHIGSLTAEDIDYFLNSSDYRNRVVFHHSLVYSNYLPTLDNFNQSATVLIDQIDDVLAPVE